MATFLTTTAGDFLTTEDGYFLIIELDDIIFAAIRRTFTVLPRTIEFKIKPRTVEFTVLPRTTEFTVK